MGDSMALFPGSGALWWTCSTPSKTGESTGVAELHQIVRCLKAVTGTRIFLKELGCGPTRPTLTHTDSRTALDAARSSRVSWDSKWVCTRLCYGAELRGRWQGNNRTRRYWRPPR